MAPDADKYRQNSPDLFSISNGCASKCPQFADPDRSIIEDDAVTTSPESLECILQPRVLRNFSYVEQPMRCFLEYEGKHLACNGKSACFMSKDEDMSSAIKNEFALLPQTDGTVILQSTRTRQFICSGPNGSVYASHTGYEGMEKWILTKSCGPNGVEGYRISSFVGQRNLTCKGNVIQTIEKNKENDMLWNIDMTSGELCFLSLTSMDMRARCDMFGNISLSTKYQGWEAWRFSEAGDGRVRISPWAHSEKLLSSTKEGKVCTTEERGDEEIWTVEKAPEGYYGVIVKSAQYGQVLRYDNKEGCFHTVSSTSFLLDENCIWDLESLHRQIYYLLTDDSKRKLEASKRGVVTRGLPIRISSEQWKIVPSNDCGAVLLFSVAREQYLSSNDSGDVSLCRTVPCDGSAKWVIEEREMGFVILSQNTGRVLVAPEQGSITTLAPGSMVRGSTRWKLEPTIPRQISKEKMQAVGTAVAIGVAGTVATPFLIGGAIGALGVAQVGLVGEIAIGSIRAVEALNTITRVTLSSSQLMLSESSCHSIESERDYETGAIGNRPFCSWQSW